MRVACLMMQKNERNLIAPWIEYHSSLFGTESIFVFDNGSTDPEVLTLLAKYAERGVNIDYSLSTRQDFEKKGDIIAEKIKYLDSNGDFHFYFPLDCDEFVAADMGNGQTSVDLNDIVDILTPFVNDERVLMIGSVFDNNPLHTDYYQESTEQRKCFFAKGACKSLDIGFHFGRAKNTDESVKTPICYFHLHHRPYREQIFFARQKLEGRVPSFAEQDLKKYWDEKRPGFNLIPLVLMTQEDFNSRYSRRPQVFAPQLRKASSVIGDFFPSADNYPEAPIKSSGNDYLGSLRGFVDSVEVRNGKAFVRGWAVQDAGNPAKILGVNIGNAHAVLDNVIKSESRPDVAKATGQETSIGAGFVIEFPLDKIPADAFAEHRLEVLIGSSGAKPTSRHLLYSQAKPWPFQQASAAAEKIISVPASPAMPPEVLRYLHEAMAQSKCYLEYGSGGSTVLAAKTGILNIISIESDARWLEAVRKRVGKGEGKAEYHYIHADIGPTKDWGFPASESHWKAYHRYPLAAWELVREKDLQPDLVLIDGRFRMACFFATVLYSRPGTRILFDDYVDRPYYHGIERYVSRLKTVDRMVEFIVPSEMPRDAIQLSLSHAVNDPR